MDEVNENALQEFQKSTHFEENGEKIEQENEDELVEPTANLFDPTLINIETKTPSLDTLIKRIKYDEIELNSSSYFQRNPNLWTPAEQSRLIESILIRFPLPAFYFDGSNDKWLVVDGLQRLSSIRNFVLPEKAEKPLRLQGMEFLTYLNGMTFNELSRDLQRVIEETSVVIYIINKGTPVSVKFNIFKRINTGGLALTPQEIRHALFQGKPAEFIAELADLPAFNQATNYALAQNARMLSRDFANRFLAFYHLRYKNYISDLDTFMSKAMASISRMTDDEKEKIKADYEAALLLSMDVFTSYYAFRKIDASHYSDGGKIIEFSAKSNPINKAIFEIFTVQFALLSQTEREKVKLNAPKIRVGFIELLKDKDFVSAVSSSTGHRAKIEIRHEAIKKLIYDNIS